MGDEQYFINKMSLSYEQILLYNMLLILYLLFLVYRHRDNSISLLIIVLFFPGIVSDLGGKTANNVYQIVTLIWCGWLCLKTRMEILWSKLKNGTIFFLLYSLYFILVSIVIHKDNPVMVFAQYSKVLVPFLLYIHFLDELEDKPDRVDYYHDLFGELLICVIVTSIFKLIIYGNYIEGWVGGLSGFHGGAAGTSLPLLGLLWLALQTRMQNHSIKDILFIIGLLLIGLSTGKRAVFLLFPLLYMILTGYVYKNRISNIFFVTVIAVPLILYFGLRLTPTLNPENKVWGSFDPEYAYNYGLKYSTGIDRTKNVKSLQEMESGVGRVGAVYWMFEHIGKGDKMAWIGKGNEYMIYADHDDYSNRNYYMGLNYRGGITGIVKKFLTSGILGVLLYTVFVVFSIYRISNRYSLMLLLTILFDYIFYNAQILESQAMFIFALFLSICSEHQDRTTYNYSA